MGIRVGVINVSINHKLSADKYSGNKNKRPLPTTLCVASQQKLTLLPAAAGHAYLAVALFVTLSKAVFKVFWKSEPFCPQKPGNQLFIYNV